MKLRDIGERKLIDTARGIIGKSPLDKLDLLDDCAVLELDDELLLVTTDMISQTTHLPRGSLFWQAGWHLVAINLSDIAAMGGEPLGVVVALGLPDDYDSKDFGSLMEGANACALKFNTSIIGGDTKHASSMTLSACAIGKVAKSEILTRKGAKPKDVVFVTGQLGRAGSAFHMLSYKRNDKSSLRDLLEIYPRLAEGRALAKSGCVTSAMDISDGLASSIYQISRINDIGFELEFENIPKWDSVESVSRKMNVSLEEMVLYFGGDYELLVTVDEKKAEKMKKIMSDCGFEFTQIGRVVRKKSNTLIKDGVSTLLEDRGYEHFRWNG